MAYDWLKGIADDYDVIVIGSGLGGLTGANVLAKAGHRVLLLEHHYQFGGLATWFTRKGGHIFDISLHGFPSGMIKTCRKYWTREIADSIVQLKDIRFVNPQMDVWTTFTRDDYTRVLVEQFKLSRETVERFYDYLRSMNYYDNNPETTRDLFERFFPGRADVHRLLMEPIAYANGSTLDDPAITYGIVFSNFMGAGVFTFRGGSDLLIEKMVAELKRNGVECRKRVLVERVEGYCAEKDWKRGYDEINEFEAQQIDSGTNIVKLFIHATQEEQDKQLAQRLDDPWKRWKTGADDYRNRNRRADYLDAMHDMFKHTDTRWAPWTVIDGNDRKSGRIAALTAIADQLEALVPMEMPPRDPAIVALAEKAFGYKAEE